MCNVTETEEIWEDIKITNYTAERYQVSNMGCVRNKKTGHIFKGCPRSRKIKYSSVSLQIAAGVQKNYFIHRLVAETFLNNPNNLPEVNHKDQDKSNPRLDNLEWCSRSYNLHYGNCIERIISGQMKHPPEFLCVENGKIYNNQSQAARELGLFPESVNMVLNGKRKHTRGFHFVWLYIIDGAGKV